MNEETKDRLDIYYEKNNGRLPTNNNYEVIKPSFYFDFESMEMKND